MYNGVIENLKIVALVSLCAYPLIKHPSLIRAILKVASYKEKTVIGIYFGVLSIIGTVTGVEVFNYIRIHAGMLGPVAGGMIGGPLVGLIAGIIGAVYRYSNGNITAAPESFAILLAGLIGGLLFLTSKNKKINLLKVYVFALIAELIRVVLIISNIYPESLAGVYLSMVAIHMIIVNPFGVMILVSLVKDIQYNQNLTGANYAEKSLEVAKQSLSVLEDGYDETSMEKIANIIYRYVEVPAVAIQSADGSCVFVGSESIKSRIRESNDSTILSPSKRNQFMNFEKYQQDMVIMKAPLRIQEQIVGELQFYKMSNEIVATDTKMIEGIASLLSLQIQNALLNDQEKLMIQWEFNALKAQVNPHFLYNTLNVIKTMIRLNPEKSQDLIVDLADFYRRSLSERGDLIPFVEELKLVKSYMDLQEARFGNKISLSIDIAPEVYSLSFPSFTIQPLVENSIIHGISNDEEVRLEIKIEAKISEGNMVVHVSDNGSGFDEKILAAPYNDVKPKKSGIGLNNINMRLKSMYYNRYTFSLSNTDIGALVTLIIPVDEGVNHANEN